MVKDADEPDFSALDVSGYNYSPNRYSVDHAKYPDRVIVGTESFPTSSFELWDHVWNSSWVVGDFIWTSIDVKRPANPHMWRPFIHDESSKATKQSPFIQKAAAPEREEGREGDPPIGSDRRMLLWRFKHSY